MLERETKFLKLVPMKSVLGREFLALQAERDKQKTSFESAEDKMAADTTPYRRSELALEKFLEVTLPLVMAAHMKLDESLPRLEVAQQKAQMGFEKHSIRINRRDEMIIWTRFAIERYRELLPKKSRKQLKAYHPGLWHDIGIAWKEFRQEIKRWQYGGQPYDGSQAMHTMIAFQLKCRYLGVAND